MPGRADLIQENNARASAAAANTPQPQETQGKSATSGIGGPRSFLGGNIDVYSALDKVEFQGGLGDFSLRGNIAYIRLWKRGGSAQQSAASVAPVQPPGSDSLEDLEDALEAAIGNRDNIANGFDPATKKYGFDPYEGEADNPIEVAESRIQIAERLLSEARQEAVSAQTPTSSATPSATVAAAPPASPTKAPTQASMGAVKSANPNGFLNTAANVGKALFGLPQGKPEYSGQAAGGGSGASSAPVGEMMWQFLFNPSELELEVGPEFKDAETWGVSDKGNSGKPLHWSHNKNAQLKFNSVLLNGYVFGRKVEVLEQGLIELFMARDGEGQHGPHVLEFVWGKRVFGPCVIKNVNIKEKMWDEGEVVNAEVSFTLEQVPEWTINDGFVDVARPGRQQLATNPVPGAAGTTTPVTAPPAAAPGGGNQPDQKPPAQNGIIPTALYEKCQKAGVYAEQFYAIQVKAGRSGAGGSKPYVINLRGQYNSLYNRARAELGSELTSRSNYPNADSRKLIVATDISIAVEDAKTGLNAITLNYNSAMSMVENAADSSRRASKAFSDSPTCKAERNKVDQNTKNQQAAQICKNKQAGASCSSSGVPPGGRIKTCSGIELICGTDGYLKNASTYRP